MSSNSRRRERYATDETYRERRIRQVAEAREAKRRQREEEKLLRGWQPIHSVPDNEVVLIYDPAIFWPILATLKDGRWSCVHYDGPEPRPTHWRYPLKVPIA